jgi:integrase
VKALATAGKSADDQKATSLPDNLIVVDDDASGVVRNPKGEHMPRYNGPYRHGERWRILIRVPGQAQQVHGTYDTEEEGKKVLRQLRIAAKKLDGLTVNQALDRYVDQMRTNGLRERSIETTLYRLKKFFGPVASQPLASVTSSQAKNLLAGLTEWSVDSRRNALAEAKTFCLRAKSNGWVEVDLLKDVKGEGKRKRGKPKHTTDEAKKYLDKCRELSATPKYLEAAVAAAIPLLLGYRASEVVDREVRDLDNGGTVLRVPRAKSQAGIRAQELPKWFQPLIARLTAGKKSTDRIFPHDRTWLFRQVQRICRLAGVPEISSHGLRGTHADLSLHAHVTALAVSQALGHTSTAVTFGHYADQGIVEQQQHRQALSVLAPTVSNA